MKLRTRIHEIVPGKRAYVVYIPAAIRDMWGIEKGDEVEMDLVDGELRVRRVDEEDRGVTDG